MIVPEYFSSLQMVNARVGYAVGGRQTQTIVHLYKTVDGGRRWVRIAPGFQPAAPVTALGESTVLFPMRLRGRFVVERSDDGGRTWRASRPFADPGHPAGPGQVVRLDPSHFYVALGEGAAAGSSAQALFRSSDGGRTFRFVSRTQPPTRPAGNGLPFGCDKTGFGFATLRVGWAGGACAGGRVFFYRTGDGGRTWRLQRLPGPAACACDTSPPRFFTPRDGALSVESYPIARVYWTTDGGARWRVSIAPVHRVYGPVAIPTRASAWVFGRRSVSRTIDAGRTWRTTRLPFDASTHTFDVVDQDVAFAVAIDQRTLLRTIDGGRSWQPVR